MLPHVQCAIRGKNGAGRKKWYGHGVTSRTASCGPAIYHYVLFFLHDLSLSLVPTAVPENVTVENVLSDTILLSWEPPPVEQQNGVLQSYVIGVTEIDSGREYNVTSLVTTHAVGSLHPYYTYSFRIAAVTIGIGPYSLPVNTTTLEAGT